MVNEIVLAGCTPTPLASYLKALGVLRLVSVECPDARGAWRGARFVLQLPWNREVLETFFLRGYRPTPILAPWNGGSGFYKKDNKVAVQAIQASSSARFAAYRECLILADVALEGMGRDESPKGADKKSLLDRLRSTLPDSALDWLDAAVLISGESLAYPPLLGTGGNDGRLDFTNNFMQRLMDVMSVDDEAPSAQSAQWLRMALYGEPAPGLIKKSIGQFAPGQVGGPNATNGFDAGSAINPWDFVLMIEGALLFAAAAVRRSADDPEGVLSFPFTVRAVAAGAGSLGQSDAASERARGELWMPLWRQYTSCAEVRALLSEGRVALGRKPARDALDFVRAVHQLGSYRGVESFERYGLLMRSGMAFLATSLAHVEVVANPRAQLLADLDKREWLSRFRRFAQGDTVATRFRVLRRKLEEALFGLASRNPSAPETQAALVLLGEINSALASSRKALEAVSPVPRLSEQWVQAANDSTPAFRIARALAGLKGTSDMLLPLLSQLLPVHPVHNTWMTPEYRGKNASKDPYCRVHIHSDAKGRLPDVMVTLLRDRLSLAQRLNMRDPGNILVSKPLQSAAGVDLTDLLQFLNGDRLDQRIAQLLPGLCLCKILPDQEPSAGEAGVPAAFALIKLVLTPDEALRGLGLLDTTDFLPVPSTLIGQLASGNIGNRAVRAAWRRLTASRLTPAVSQRALPELIGISPLRAAAALLIPLRSSAIRAMSRMILADGGKQRGGEQAHAADLLTQEGETV